MDKQVTRLLRSTVLFQNLGPLVVQYVLSAYLHSFPSVSTDSTWKAGAAMLLLKRSVYFYNTRQDSDSNTCFVEFTEVNIYMEKKRYFLFLTLIHVCQIHREWKRTLRDLILLPFAFLSEGKGYSRIQKQYIAAVLPIGHV